MPEPGSENGVAIHAQVNLAGNEHEECAGEAGNKTPPDVMDLFREMMRKLDKIGEGMKNLQRSKGC